MKWFDYLRKTPVAQILTDWREYRGLKKALSRAEKDMVVSGMPLVRHYGIDDSIGTGNACIKSKQLVGEFELFEHSPCAYQVVRCPHFAPEGHEQKCQNNLCVMWKDNNQYCENRQKFDDLKIVCAGYWANKFMRVK
ncbi:MAG: hypothetical protein IKA25_00655 [Alphaproteobacteria bacterium]|nr:hypothetical protein [Alphaproteobacteria bacterium]